MDMAREVFAKMDWESELAAVQAAVAAGKEVFLPEFGLTQDEDRTLVISTVDSDTVSFYMQYPDRVSVYSVGPKGATTENPRYEKAFSIEFCGGPHVTHTGEIGHFKIAKEEASSAGIRRIRGVIED